MKTGSLNVFRAGILVVMQARILLSLVWRSVFLFPLGLLASVAVLAFPALVIVLPVWAGLFFVNGSWLAGSVMLASMIPVIGVRRWIVSLLVDPGM